MIYIMCFLGNNMDGIIIVNKEKDMTSRDVVNILCKFFNTKKIGHTGTLDPIATGVLIITIGKCTKLNELLTSEYKEYIATMKLGILTDTLDITGKIIDKKNYNINKENLIKVLKSFVGKSTQEVPLYSAVKVNGKKLYEYAREKKEILLPKKEVTIFDIKLLNFNLNTFTFICKVSKGTYIRSLVNDISKELEVPMCMLNLKRTKIGQFDIKDSYTINDIENNNYRFYDINKVLDYKKVEISKNIETAIKNGNKIENIYNCERILFTKDNRNIIIYENYSNNMMKPIFRFD